MFDFPFSSRGVVMRTSGVWVRGSGSPISSRPEMLNTGLFGCGFEGFIMDLSLPSPEVLNHDLFARVFVSVRDRLPLASPEVWNNDLFARGFRVFHASLYIPVLRCYYDLLEGG